MEIPVLTMNWTRPVFGRAGPLVIANTKLVAPAAQEWFLAPPAQLARPDLTLPGRLVVVATPASYGKRPWLRRTRHLDRAA